jgi:hypothetical protein
MKLKPLSLPSTSIIYYNFFQPYLDWDVDSRDELILFFDIEKKF